MTDIQQIYNYLQLTENLATSGQPLESELRYIADQGYVTVINLALSDAEYSLDDEQGSIYALGMTYIHLPVNWDNPSSDDLKCFFKHMEKNKHQKLFIHCAANMRVSCFIALYRVIHLGWSINDAMSDVYKIWTPNATWQHFIDEHISSKQSRLYEP